jgi:membrane associated rhomboid family serine protease
VIFPYADDNPTRRTPIVTIALIVVCVATFLHQLALPREGLDAFVYRFGAIPGVLTGRYEFTDPDLAAIPAGATLVTSMFLHGGWSHLLGNMMFLWIFGNNVEDAMGRLRFFVFYVLSGVGAAATHVASDPGSSIPMIGASGAISGILGAYFLLHPHARVRAFVFLLVIFTTIALPAWVFLGYWFLTQWLNIMGAANDGVAWWAHFGGFLVGAALVPFFKDREVPLFSGPRRRAREFRF